MVANLNDKLIISDVKKYVMDRKTLVWSQDFGATTSADYAFIPYYAAGNTADIGFVAVEIAKLREFQDLCHEVNEERHDAWDSNYGTKYEFTVNNQFKYGQNNAKTFRFLVLQNPKYKPFQHRFSAAAGCSEAATTLGNLVRIHGHLASKLPFGQDILGVLKSIIGDDLHSF